MNSKKVCESRKGSDEVFKTDHLLNTKLLKYDEGLHGLCFRLVS